MYIKTFRFILLSSILLGTSYTLYPKRHALTSKVERYEKQAQSAAQGKGSLSSALSKQTKSMSFDEARLAQEYYRSVNNSEMIIKCGERLLAVGGDQEALMLTRLELADLFLEQKNYEEAEKHAQEFLLYYPGSAQGKKASFISVKSSFLAQQNSFRDQEKTHAAIDRAQEFLRKYPQDTDYTDQLEMICTQSYLKLIRYEMNIISTQLNMYRIAQSAQSLASAKKRLTYIKEQYLPKASLAFARVTELEIEIAQIENNSELIQQKKAELALYKEKQTKTPATSDSWFTSSYNGVKEFFIEDNQKFFAS